jgi:hypothetical protein
MKKYLRILTIGFLFISPPLGMSFLFFQLVLPVHAAVDHVVISEVQLSGGVPNDEFIELYNPTTMPISLENWKLTKKTQTGTESSLVASMSGVIPFHGYYLIARPEYDGSTVPDITYSAEILSTNNTVLLYDDKNILIDKIGFNAAVDKEISTIGGSSNPTASRSVERKANSFSDLASMVNGIDQFAGNGEDSDNNSVDFIVRTVSNPQNSKSAIEPVISQIPTETITPTLLPTPTTEIAIAPTSTISPSPTPTQEPTSTPIEMPSPTPSLTPLPTFTPTPTIAFIPSATPLPTFTPTPTIVFPSYTPIPTLLPSPSAAPHHVLSFPGFRVIWKWHFRPVHFGRVFVSFPYVDCKVERLL